MNYEAKKIIEYLKRFDFSKGERPVILEEEYKNLVSYVERLNNIINELEKDIDLELYKTRANDEYNKGLFNAFRYVKDKLQELKGSDKE